jgi:hypothetical protein
LRNKWTLKRNPGPPLVVTDKRAPEGLSGSYLLYTGNKIEQLKRYTEEKTMSAEIFDKERIR